MDYVTSRVNTRLQLWSKAHRRGILNTQSMYANFEGRFENPEGWDANTTYEALSTFIWRCLKQEHWLHYHDVEEKIIELGGVLSLDREKMHW